VSTPGIDRTIKDGAEFGNYVGRKVCCWLVGAAAWTGGVLVDFDERKITLNGQDGLKEIDYENIAKAKLDSA
jgi:ribosome maturation factor RimP